MVTYEVESSNHEHDEGRSPRPYNIAVTTCNRDVKAGYMALRILLGRFMAALRVAISNTSFL